jgi:uroporphyrin-III C-methyltransferase/precorrin-2 dehydrogenase/sirohydrochlorin ferrochelatase
MLARPNQTAVIYMGVSALPEICARLVAHGLPAQTPAAVVQNATTPRQRSVAGSLAALAELAAAAGMGAPALIVVGEVVRLQSRLQWFRPQLQEAERGIRATA